jgi:hypothetical protein
MSFVCVCVWILVVDSGNSNFQSDKLESFVAQEIRSKSTRKHHTHFHVFVGLGLLCCLRVCVSILFNQLETAICFRYE